VGVYALIRMFTLVFTGDVAFTHTILLWVAALTMVTGVLGAAAQNDVRKILSFHIVSQIGYMILGLALFTPLAIVGAVFYLVHHIIVKANLFLIAGVADRIAGSTDLAGSAGSTNPRRLLAVLFLIPAFSLAGFPPLSGFWAKYVLVKAALEAEGLDHRRRRAGGRAADDLLDDQDLGRGVLETASRGASQRWRSSRPASAGLLLPIARWRPDAGHRLLPRALRHLRRNRGGAASRPERLYRRRSGRDAP
jgi:hypothetical protein